jgi:hypothetical protein
VPKRASTAIALLLAIVYAAVISPSVWKDVVTAKHGRDYATYHYAVAEAFGGGDPYDTRALDERARAEKTRTSVHPFFYPPPFLLTMLWAAHASLASAYRAYFWINQAALVLVLLVLRRWYGVPALAIGILLATFTPIPDDIRMGQANLVVLLFAVLGLWRASGVLVSLAAMCKMSPALYLAQWTAERRWRPVIVAICGAFAWSAVALTVAPWKVQLEFYRDVLPGFSTGEYHGLTVPISLPANHSLADIFNRLWPGPNNHILSSTARIANSIASLALTGITAWFARTRRDALGSALFAGAFTVAMLVTPIYTYEHHLVFLLLPLTALATAASRGSMSRPLLIAASVAYVFVSWPLAWIRAASSVAPSFAGAFYETKFVGLLALWALCIAVGRDCPIRKGA